jgi:alpha-L-rhamnosidase
METFPANAHWARPPFTRANSGYGVNEWYMFRNRLLVKEAEPVFAHIAVDSKYWLYVNGKLAVREGGLKRGPVPEGSYFDTVDLSDHLQAGENTIGLLLWYFGKHGFSHRDSGTPGLLFHAVGAAMAEPWKVCRHPAYFDPGYVHDAYRLSESSVGFDARLDIPGWTKPEFDDSSWAEAIECGTPGSPPWGVLEPRGFPQWHWSEPRDFAKIEKTECNAGDGYVHYRCRLPYNAHFVPILEVESAAGIRVDINVGQDTSRLCNAYITRAGCQSHEFEAWLSGEEVIYKVPSDAIQVKRLQYRETCYPAEFAGSFACDDAVLNQLWQKSRRTLLVTMRDTFMDCPCRERAQWPGDMVVQLAQVPYCLGRNADFLVRKGLRETLRWQRPDGVIYGPVPEGNWKCELPSQMLSILSPFGIWTYFMNTGDRETLAELYPFAKRYLDIWKFQESGLIRYRPDEKGLIPVMEDGASVGIWDWIDWGDGIDSEPSLNAWFVLAAKGARQMAEVLGAEQDAAEIADKERKVTAAMREHFWDARQGAYVSPDFADGPDDRAQALAVLSGVASPDQFGALAEIFAHVERSCPYMEKYVLEALFRMGMADQALTRMKSRYCGLVKNNSSTLWERWPENTIHPGTTNHSWSGGPLTLLSEIVAGIYPLEPGWKRFAIAPRPGFLTRIQSEVATSHGAVSLDAVLEGETWRVRLNVPEGTDAVPDFSSLGRGESPGLIGPGEWRGDFIMETGVTANDVASQAPSAN